MRTIFKKHSLQELFKKQGYVVISSFLKQGIVEELTNIYNKANPKNLDPGFYCTLYNESDEQKKKVSDKVKRVLKSITSDWLIDYNSLVVDYPTKGALTEGDVAMHQDWVFVDEKKYTSLNIWVPLVDVNRKNGAYYVLKGSNNIEHTIRGSHMPLPCNEVKYKVQYENMTYLPMKAGDAIIYDHRLMHRTPPNTTDKDRIALSLNLIPAEAKPIHYYMHADSGKVELFEIEYDFFTKYKYNPIIRTNKLPDGVKSLGFVEDYKYVCFTEKQVMPLCSNKTLLQKLKVGLNSFKGLR